MVTKTLFFWWFIWHAVKIAKSTGQSVVPSNMMLNNVTVTGHEIVEHFAEFLIKMKDFFLGVLEN